MKTDHPTRSEIIASALFKANSEKQRQFIRSRADFTVYGGAKGGGKSYALLMQAARHIHRPGYTAVIFRQSVPQIRQLGGLWETAFGMYYVSMPDDIEVEPNETRLEFKFPSGAKIGFGHIGHDRELADWQGSQIAMIGVDQAEEFTRRQLLFLLGLNRPTATLMQHCQTQSPKIAFKPRIYATCNPDPDCFLRSFMTWWIDSQGYAIEERSGIIRYFAIVDDTEVWADCPEEIRATYGDVGVTSFTFIPARVEDNVDLMRSTPEYLQRLKSMGRVEKERYWLGNWNVRWSAGDYFKREQFPIADTAPPLVEEWRYWDRAATVGSHSWTVGVRMGRDEKGRYWITDVIRFQAIAQEVEQRIANVTAQDGYEVNVGIEGDPGQAGKSEAESYVRNLAGFNVVINTVRESKGARARPLSAQVAIGNVYLVRAPWNDEFLREMENFDGGDKCQADQVDSSSGAFHLLTSGEGDPGIDSIDLSKGNGNNGNGNGDAPGDRVAAIQAQLRSRLVSRLLGR